MMLSFSFMLVIYCCIVLNASNGYRYRTTLELVHPYVLLYFFHRFRRCTSLDFASVVRNRLLAFGIKKRRKKNGFQCCCSAYAVYCGTFHCWFPCTEAVFRWFMFCCTESAYSEIRAYYTASKFMILWNLYILSSREKFHSIILMLALFVACVRNRTQQVYCVQSMASSSIFIAVCMMFTAVV